MGDMGNQKPSFKDWQWWVNSVGPLFVAVITLIIGNCLGQADIKDWIISTLIVIIAYALIVIVSEKVTMHYNAEHGYPGKCREAMDENCNKLLELHCKYSEECKEKIRKMNQKITEQKLHLSQVDHLVENAKKLRDMYGAAVAKRLRTNEQVAKLESEVLSGKKVYIMTSSFMLERYNKDFRKSIVTNILRGVKYRYIIPNNKEEEYMEMVYAIMYEIQEDCKSNNTPFTVNGLSDRISAVMIPKEYVLLTIAYYELAAPEYSSVIVKLPADSMEEVNQSKPLIYLVPEGATVSANEETYNYEHRVFREHMAEIYRKERRDKNELSSTEGELKRRFPGGIKLSEEAENYVKLD